VRRRRGRWVLEKQRKRNEKKIYIYNIYIYMHRKYDRRRQRSRGGRRRLAEATTSEAAARAAAAAAAIVLARTPPHSGRAQSCVPSRSASLPRPQSRPRDNADDIAPPPPTTVQRAHTTRSLCSVSSSSCPVLAITRQRPR